MIKLYAIKHNTEDLYYSDIAVGFVSLSPLELFTEQHYQRVLDGMWPEDRAVSHIVVFDLVPSPPKFTFMDGEWKEVY